MRIPAVLLLVLVVVVVVMVVVVVRPGHASLVNAVPCKKLHKASDDGSCYSTLIPHTEVLVAEAPPTILPIFGHSRLSSQPKMRIPAVPLVVVVVVMVMVMMKVVVARPDNFSLLETLPCKTGFVRIGRYTCIKRDKPPNRKVKFRRTR
ncbi:hypothetical protein E2C01_078398 [Portunus trituberculatus]|uniref:Uncharacterized protein n=1 Tax=Portunus trituberculatus TaxID=210409 RepID=A0A5B7IMH8_PORTR|nr:hypothetical protein [Portunus trituberculatus]